jgi:hypothetical protein
MSEIHTPLTRLQPGETFTADEDGALVITEAHSHADLIRYVVGDIGEDALGLVSKALVEKSDG